ncbi:MAG TPA: sigma-70 family RNA polymerase sigma factor [Bryobacterales bacterium]|nr:sigma-70 family RNA polymerase sigma factor [Bryobacterales bacterium]
MTLRGKTTPLARMDDAPNDDSWKNWFQRYGPRLLLCARQWTRSLADAEDVVQDAFIRFWRRQRGLGGEPLPLLLTSIRRAAFDRARREQRRAAREQETEAGESAPLFEPLAVGDERRMAVEAALRRLPAEQREVLALKIWSNLTFEEIGGQLEISPNTAASRYRYALAALRKELTPDFCHG